MPKDNNTSDINSVSNDNKGSSQGKKSNGQDSKYSSESTSGLLDTPSITGRTLNKDASKYSMKNRAAAPFI